MSQGKVGFFVAMTEYERGWGSKPDGFVVFPDENIARMFILDTYAKRIGPVPDYYIDYKMVGYKPISEGLYNKMSEFGSVYVD